MEELSDYLKDIFNKAYKEQPLKFELLKKRWDSFNKQFAIPTSPIPVDCTIKNVRKAHDPDAELIQISAIRTWSVRGKEKEPVFYGLMERTFAIENRGEMIFDYKNNPSDFAYNKNLAMYLFFCAYNQSNIGQPWHVSPINGNYIIRQHDRKLESKMSVSIELQMAENVSLLRTIPEDELESIGTVRYNMANPDPNEVLARLLVEVKKNPLVINEVLDSKKQTLLSNLKKAESNGVINFDANSKRWRLGDNVTLVIESGEDKYEAMANHLINDKGGLRKHEMIMDGLEAVLKKKK